MRVTDFGWLLLGVALNAAAQLGLKAATRATGVIRVDGAGLWRSGMELAANTPFWLALCAYGVSVLVWTIGLSRVPVSQAYPVLSLGYIVTALAAWITLGEIISPTRWVGIGVIMVGVWLVVRS
jgi:multidrug transporter EmrE-like cation transporter